MNTPGCITCWRKNERRKHACHGPMLTSIPVRRVEESKREFSDSGNCVCCVRRTHAASERCKSETSNAKVVLDITDDELAKVEF